MAKKYDAELIEFLHKMLTTLGAPALHADLDKLNEDVADDIETDDKNNVKSPVNVATSSPVGR